MQPSTKKRPPKPKPIPLTVNALTGMGGWERHKFFKGPGRGLQTKAAARAGVDNSVVSKVCNGVITGTDAVRASIEMYLRRLDRKQKRSQL